MSYRVGDASTLAACAQGRFVSPPRNRSAAAGLPAVRSDRRIDSPRLQGLLGSPPVGGLVLDHFERALVSSFGRNEITCGTEYCVQLPRGVA